MGEKVRSGERKKERRRTQVKTMAYRVAFGARKACGARNTGVPIDVSIIYIIMSEYHTDCPILIILKRLSNIKY